MLNTSEIFVSILFVLHLGISNAHSEVAIYFIGDRGLIFDRNGLHLAFNFSINMLYANPKEIKDKPLTAKYLTNLFPWILLGKLCLMLRFTKIEPHSF